METLFDLLPLKSLAAPPPTLETVFWRHTCIVITSLSLFIALLPMHTFLNSLLKFCLFVKFYVNRIIPKHFLECSSFCLTSWLWHPTVVLSRALILFIAIQIPTDVFIIVSMVLKLFSVFNKQKKKKKNPEKSSLGYDIHTFHWVYTKKWNGR